MNIRLLAAVALAWSVALAAATPPTGAGAAPGYQSEIEAWRAQRLTNLTSENGWLTLVGLYWFKPGDNTFGRAHDNALVLDNPSLAAHAGTFTLEKAAVRFSAARDAGITSNGRAVTSAELAPDTSGAPTILSSGTLRFHVIDRVGHLGLRVRDVANPLRTHFKGLDYFPIDATWVFHAQFHAYEPAKHVQIVNVLGMVDDMTAPGYLTFTRDGKQWRLDALLEEPKAEDLFIMFADGTSGRETYGAGRFMYLPLPGAGEVLLDFNKAYNPPCAFNEFATCPLPPRQNRLALRVEAGEKSYQAGH
ncbi:MAG TPA: DUF1684 domain-containing protein [Steroidobacteraceae bacterium]|jgi:uncharacterized protein (DUF1684 family)